MRDPEEISTHYTRGDLTAVIRGGIEKLGKTIDTVTLDDLAAVDEFHIGGREASAHFLDQFELTADKRILDVGCGIGGPARFAASRYGCQVDGIDLTREYVEIGQEIYIANGLIAPIEMIARKA
jgi:2-polyprenyl-3-methyl-5-hydroxy-6-metoxy-1,4-benzoquinol methylase